MGTVKASGGREAGSRTEDAVGCRCLPTRGRATQSFTALNHRRAPRAAWMRMAGGMEDSRRRAQTDARGRRGCVVAHRGEGDARRRKQP